MANCLCCFPLISFFTVNPESQLKLARECKDKFSFRGGNQYRAEFFGEAPSHIGISKNEVVLLVQKCVETYIKVIKENKNTKCHDEACRELGELYLRFHKNYKNFDEGIQCSADKIPLLAGFSLNGRMSLIAYSARECFAMIINQDKNAEDLKYYADKFIEDQNNDYRLYQDAVKRAAESRVQNAEWDRARRAEQISQNPTLPLLEEQNRLLEKIAQNQQGYS